MTLAIAKLLTPVDFADTSRRALSYSLRLAETLSATVTVLHVTEPPRRGMDALLRTGDADHDSMTNHLLQHAEDELTAFLATVPECKDTSFERRVVFGRPDLTIVDTAQKEAFDLIVMGTQGGAGLTGLLLGSSAQRVIASAPCPVVAVKNLPGEGD